MLLPIRIMARGGPAADGTDGSASEVSGMAIFWILLGLSLAIVFHPLVSSIHRPDRQRRLLHVSPIFCLADLAYFVREIAGILRMEDVSPPDALRIVVSYRLRAAFAGAGVDAGPESDKAFGVMLDFRLRAVGAMLNVALYAKIYGFTGIRAWATVADVLFVSWLAMEALLLAGYYLAQQGTAGACRGYDPILEGLRQNRNLLLDFLLACEACVPLLLFLRTWEAWNQLEWFTILSAMDLMDRLDPIPMVSRYTGASDVFFLPELLLGLCVYVFSLTVALFLLVILMGGLVSPGLCYLVGLRGCVWVFCQARADGRVGLDLLWIRAVVLTQFLMYLAYFIWIYDPTGTSKASWTEMLG